MAASSSSHTRPSLAALESAAQQLLQRVAMYNTDAPHEAEARAADVPDDDTTYSHDKTSSSSDDRSSRRAREAMALRAQRYATVLRVMDLLDTRKSQAKRADDSNDNDNNDNDNDDKHVLARARAHVAAAASTMGSDDEVETIDLSHYAATTSGHLVTLCARGDGVAGDTTRFDNYVAPHDDDDDDGDEHAGDVTHALSTVTHADDDDNDKDEQSQQPLRELPSLDRVLCLDDDDDDNDTAAAAATSSAPVLCSSDDNSDGSDDDDSVVLPGLAHSSSSAACNNDNIHNVSSSSAAALSAAVSNDAAAQQLRCALRALTAEADDGVYAFALDALHDYDADMLGHAQRTYGYARRV